MKDYEASNRHLRDKMVAKAAVLGIAEIEPGFWKYHTYVATVYKNNLGSWVPAIAFDGDMLWEGSQCAYASLAEHDALRYLISRLRRQGEL